MWQQAADDTAHQKNNQRNTQHWPHTKTSQSKTWLKAQTVKSVLSNALVALRGDFKWSLSECYTPTTAAVWRSQDPWASSSSSLVCVLAQRGFRDICSLNTPALWWWITDICEALCYIMFMQSGGIALRYQWVHLPNLMIQIQTSPMGGRFHEHFSSQLLRVIHQWVWSDLESDVSC